MLRLLSWISDGGGSADRAAGEANANAQQGQLGLERPLRVMLIDDSAEFLIAATALLRSYPGLEVVGGMAVTATGLQLLPTLRPDLVLIDLAMPGANGLEAIRQIKRMPDPPLVIMLTLYDDAYYRNAAREAGADGFVGKSRLAADLFPTIRQLFV